MMTGEGEGTRYVQGSEPANVTLTSEQLIQLLEERTAQVSALEATIRQQQQQGEWVITVPVLVVPDTQDHTGRVLKTYKPDSLRGKEILGCWSDGSIK